MLTRFLPMLTTSLLCGVSANAAMPPVNQEIKRETRMAMEALADCWLRSDGSEIESALAGNPRSGAFERWSDGRSADCWLDAMKKHGVSLSYSGETFRYALAEGVFRRRLAGTRLTDLERVLPLAHGIADYRSRCCAPRGREAIKKSLVEKQAGVYLSMLGECVVRADPDNTQRLLASDSLTSDEGTAFGALMPAISGCVDKSQKFAFDRQNLRGALALNYLRLARAPRVSEAPAAGDVR